MRGLKVHSLSCGVKGEQAWVAEGDSSKRGDWPPRKAENALLDFSAVR